MSVNSCVSTIRVLGLQAYSSMTDLYFSFIVVTLDQLCQGSLLQFKFLLLEVYTNFVCISDSDIDSGIVKGTWEE